jgi:hypothetical protein
MEENVLLTLIVVSLIVAISAWLTGTKAYLESHGEERTEFLYARILAPIIDAFRAHVIRAEKQDKLPIAVYVHDFSLIMVFVLWGIYVSQTQH